MQPVGPRCRRGRGQWRPRLTAAARRRCLCRSSFFSCLMLRDTVHGLNSVDGRCDSRKSHARVSHGFPRSSLWFAGVYLQHHLSQLQDAFDSRTKSQQQQFGVHSLPGTADSEEISSPLQASNVYIYIYSVMYSIYETQSSTSKPKPPTLFVRPTFFGDISDCVSCSN